MDSSDISKLLEKIGKQEKKRNIFLEKWIKHLASLNALYFDISSISSYSSSVSYIEWGYNRDKEKLAQLNIGVVYCQDRKLPVWYCPYGGSIVDVSTLKNCKIHLSKYGLKEYLFILDKGFYSQANVLLMNAKEERINFVIPLPFKLKEVRRLLAKHRRKLKKPDTAFCHNQSIMHCVKSDISIGDAKFEAHIFYDEMLEVEIKNNLLSKLFDIQNGLTLEPIQKLKEWIDYRDANIPIRYRDFFKWNKTSKKIEMNPRKINAYFSTGAYYVIATNMKGMLSQKILSHYRNRDLVEKVFDVIKNEMDGKRLRTHNDYTTLGKLFILFVSIIIYSEITRVMNKCNLFKNYTLIELLLELNKIKINTIKGENDDSVIISEVSKKQRNILKCFDIDIAKLHGY